MKYRISASIRDINDGESRATICVRHELDSPIVNRFLTEFYLAILKGMRDYNEEKFQVALTYFINEEYHQYEN